jgi:hypothetical protein
MVAWETENAAGGSTPGGAAASYFRSPINHKEKIMISKVVSCIQHHAARAVLALGLVALLAPASLHAGPPLICHPYEIGAAKSLPGATDGHWLGISRSYDRQNLVGDTLALLTPDTPVLVRMETLRRAAIYATSEMRGWEKNAYTAEDREISMTLLKQLRGRADTKDEAKRALALFDAGFFAETLRQTNMDPGFDGYPLLVQAAGLRPADAEIQFALAIAGVATKRAEQAEHLARARAAAKSNSLLASNIASHFSKS